jgi:ArsR family transcriptional regulator
LQKKLLDTIWLNGKIVWQEKDSVIVSDKINKYVLKANVMKALAHPTRLFIADELSKGERCVCELTEMIGDDISTVSKHLSVLKNAGIVSAEKRGMQVFYSLQVPCVVNFFSCIEDVLKTNSGKKCSLKP